jgi:hypothetical protein
MAAKATGCEKLYVTVMLCVTADSNKLPPYIILNRKTVPKENFCKDVIVRLKKMSSKLMEVWLGCVWERLPGALSNPWSMLAVDAFCADLSNRIRNRLRSENTDLVIIPSGTASQLQPLGVSVNTPFKHLVCKHCDAELNRYDRILTPSGKIRASVSIIVEWISKSWKAVPVNIIPKSFLKC